MENKTSVMTHGKGEDNQEGPHLAEILPHDGEMLEHKSGDPVRGSLEVHEFSSSPIKANYEEVLGAKNRK